MTQYIKIIIAILLLTGAIGAEESIRIRPPQSENDSSHDYFRALLTLALQKSEAHYVVTTENMTQERALTELEQGAHIDIDWAGTTRERERRLLPIRIPLAGGLLGFRVPAIRAADTTRFATIKTLAQLRRYTCVQGTHWPDSDILEAAGLTVKRVTQFKSMYPMLQHKRIDFFPRGLQEVYSEVASVGASVVAYDKLLIAYRFPMYFFVSPGDSVLATRIESGLRAMIADGSFQEHMMAHPATKACFPLSRYKKSTVITLENSDLSPETPLQDSALWFQF